MNRYAKITQVTCTIRPRAGLLLMLMVATTMILLIANASATEYTVRQLTGTDGHTWAYDIDNSGRVVGRCSNMFSESDSKAVLWNVNGAVTWLGQSSCAFGLNDASDIVGTRYSNSRFTAVRWDEYRNVNVVTPSLESDGRAYGINQQGTIVGGSNSRAYVWQTNGSRVSLMVPLLRQYSSSQAYGINDSGYIVGCLSGNDIFSRYTTPVRWNPDGSITWLQDPYWDGDAYARGINNSGMIVGYVEEDRCKAAIWDSTGRRTWLEAVPGFGVRDTFAYGINDSGQVIAGTTQQNGLMVAYVLTPVPEPASMLALLTGLSAFWAVTHVGRGSRVIC